MQKMQTSPNTLESTKIVYESEKIQLLSALITLSLTLTLSIQLVWKIMMWQLTVLQRNRGLKKLRIVHQFEGEWLE